jgi:large conductance mechanosensitive channel
LPGSQSPNIPGEGIMDPRKSALTLFDQFKAFAFKGNVVDLAVGVIIGGAFGNIVQSLVKNLIMPIVGAILPGPKGYEGWSFTIRGQPIPYGHFLGDLVNFVILAVALFFFIVKFLGWLMRSRKEEAATTPPLTKDQELLAEIRDLLKNERSREVKGDH